MKTVSFKQLKDGTREDYDMLRPYEAAYAAGLAGRVLRELERSDHETVHGLKITQFQHALQTATRALDDGADEDWIVSALLHDIGEGLATFNHDRFAAELIRPYVREECTWVVEHHAGFQAAYFGRHTGVDPDQRERFRGHIHFQACLDFCERWDQTSFDPDYRTTSLAQFEPFVIAVFSRKPNNPGIIKPYFSAGISPKSKSTLS